MNARYYWVLANGIFLAAFGAAFLIAPHFFYKLFTDAGFATASAAIDARATYGGFALGVAIWLIVCARQNIRLGLLGLLLMLAAIVPGRTVGLLIDGQPNAFMYIFYSAEILFLVVTLALLRPAR